MKAEDFLTQITQLANLDPNVEIVVWNPRTRNYTSASLGDEILYAEKENGGYKFVRNGKYNVVVVK